MIDIPYKYKKWSTLIGGFLIQLSIGSILTFGNMLPYVTSYLRSQDKLNIRYSQAVWIATAYNFAFSISSLASGLIDSTFKLNPKIFILIGFVISTTATCVTYFTLEKSFLLVVLTYGIIFGIGSGLAYVAPLSIAMKWFPKNSGFSNSFILLGYATSSIIFDQFQTMYINPYNYSPDMPYSNDSPNEKYFSKQDLLERIPKTFLILGGVYGGLQLIGLCLLSIKKDQDKHESINQSENVFSIEIPSLVVNSLGVLYESPEDGLTLKQSIKKPVFWILFIQIFSQIVPCGLVLNFYKTFGQIFISDDKFLSQVGSIAALFNALGTFLWGFLIEKYSFKICFLLLSTSLVGLTSTIYLIQFTNFKYLYALHVGLIMVCRSGIFVLMPTVTAKTFGPKHFQAIYGALFMAALVSSLVIGVLGSHSNLFGWFWLFFTCAMIGFLGWLLTFLFNVRNSKGQDI